MNLFNSLRPRLLLAKIDKEGLRDIQKRYASSTSQYAKYADVERWLKRNIPRIRRLGLDRSDPKEINDPVCNELVDLFGVERKVWRIQPFEPLPDFGRKFDLITAFSTAFHRSADKSVAWGIDEWNFFLDDLFARQLKPGGQVFFDINSGKDKRFFPAAVRELFARRGADIDGEFVSWKPKPAV